MSLTTKLDCSSNEDYTVITLRMVGKDKQDNYIVYQCKECGAYTLIQMGRDRYKCKACDGGVTPATDGKLIKAWIEEWDTRNR